ncbi:hypothetical protein JCM5350_005689 [Sporobolomyces pararoseus]
MSAKRARVDPSEKEESDPFPMVEDAHSVKKIHIPIDVWLIIAESIDPFTLLHLARTTKDLRATFMSKSYSYSIWKKAFKRIGVILNAQDLLRLFPVLHPKVFDSLPPADRLNRYEISKVKAMNVELVQSLADGKRLEAWRNKIVSARQKNFHKRIKDDLKKKDYACNIDQVIDEVANSNKALVSVPIFLSDREWKSIGPPLVAAVEYSALEKDEELARRRRPNLQAYFEKMNKSKLFPCFPIFLEIPFVAQTLKSSQADYSSTVDTEMSRNSFAVKDGVEAAQRWIKLSFARVAASTLSTTDHAFPAEIQAALNPPGSSQPPAEFAGISDSSENSTGFKAKDPATITNAKLSRLLGNYTMECFFYAGQEPTGYREVWQSRFEEMNSEDYKGPLFPRFNSYWNKVLNQLLDQVQLDDGGAKPMSSYLEALGPNFSCGACSARSASNLLASNLLKHIRSKHYRRPEDTPQAGLVIYKGPLPQDIGSGGGSSASAEEPLTRTRSGRI